MPTLTLEPTNERDLNLLLSLAERLGIKTTLSSVSPPLTKEERMRLLNELSGSWQSDQTADELVREIYEARYSRDRSADTSL